MPNSINTIPTIDNPGDALKTQKFPRIERGVSIGICQLSAFSKTPPKTTAAISK